MRPNLDSPIVGKSLISKPILFASCLILALAAGGASAHEVIEISAEPEIANSFEPVTLTVSGFTSCPFFSEPEVSFRITIRWRNRCLNPGPAAPFERTFTVGPFDSPTTLVARVVDEERAPVAETRIFVRSDAVGFQLIGADGEPFPRLLNTREELAVRIQGVDECPRLGAVERQGNVFQIEIETGCAFSPPLPREFFRFVVPLGRLSRGLLDLRLVDGSGAQLIRLRTIVTERPPTLAFSPANPSHGDVIMAAVALPGVEICPPLRGVSVEGHFVRIDYDESCIAPPPPSRPLLVRFEAEIGRLAEAPYDVEIRDMAGQIAHAERLVVIGAGRCVTSETSLCLNGGRFEVKASWRTADGKSGPAHAVAETDDSGLFYFFNRENVELLVKVLDACDPPFERFWFLAGGLTAAEVDVTVTDLVTGAVRTYSNPLGSSFQPVVDTQAFATCP